jgi:hypothetical protein
MNLPLFSPSN